MERNLYRARIENVLKGNYIKIMKRYGSKLNVILKLPSINYILERD